MRQPLLNPLAGNRPSRFPIASLDEAFPDRAAPLSLRENTERLVAEL
jgi:hypothetical protein